MSRVSWNGEVFVYGVLGLAQVTVPFESIRDATFEDGAEEGERTAVITTRDGQVVKLTVDDDLMCYGRTEFGNYQLEVRDLRRITEIAAEP